METAQPQSPATKTPSSDIPCKAPVTLRSTLLPGEDRLIVDTIVKGQRHVLAPVTDHARTLSHYALTSLARCVLSSAHVTVADIDGTAVGFLLHREDVLVYAYVKLQFRHAGIGWMMLADVWPRGTELVVPMTSPSLGPWLAACGYSHTYNPMLLG